MIRPICVFLMMVTVVLVGKILLVDDPLFTWGYFAIMIAAADQIRTKILIGETYKQTISLSPIAAIWTVLYLPPLHAFYACAVAYAFSAGVLEWSRFNIKNRLVNVLSMTMASAGMILVYTLLTNFWGAVWPSVAAAIAAVTGTFVYDAVNVLTISIPLHYADRLSWRDIYRSWANYFYYPLLIAVVAITLATFVTAFQWGLPLIALAIVLFLKPTYRLPALSKIGV